MATKRKTYGPFTIEEVKTEMIRLNSGLSIHIERNATLKDRIDYVRIGDGVRITGVALAQAAKVLLAIDESKRFVCGEHGSYASSGETRQSAVCLHCHAGKMAAVNAAIDGRNAVLDEEDA